MKSKKGICIVLLMSMLVVVFYTSTAISQKKRFEGVTLNWAMYPCADLEAAKKLILEFEKKFGAKVNIIETPHIKMYEKQMLSATAGSSDLDIYAYTSCWAPPFVGAGYVVPLEQFLNETRGDPGIQDIIPSMLDHCTYNGKLYGFPVYGDVFVLAYRKDLFEEAGIEPPKTYEEYIRVCKRMEKDRDGDGRVDFWGAIKPRYRDDSIVNDWQNFLGMYEWDVIRGQKGGDLPPMKDDPSKYFHPVFNQGRGIEATQFMVDLYKKYKIYPPGVLNMSYFAAFECFGKGDTAMYIVYGDQCPDLVTTEVKDEIEFALVPTRKGVRRCHGGGWMISVSAFSRHKFAAYKLLEWIYGEKNARKLAFYGATPTRYSSLRNPELQEKFRWYPQMLAMMPYRKQVPSFPEWHECTTILAGYLQEVHLGTHSVKQGLDIAARKIDKVLKRAGYYK